MNTDEKYWNDLHSRVKKEVHGRRKKRKVFLAGLSTLILISGLFGIQNTLLNSNRMNTNSGEVNHALTANSEDAVWIFSPLEDDWFEHL
jgi:hypothetical protein